MAEIKDKELLEIIFAQTHIKDENDEDIPHFCFITDISDEFDLSEEDIAVLALKNGYSVLKPFADETMLGGYILCAEGCGKEQVEQMYQDVYDEVPEIAEIVLGENDTLVEKGKEENKEEPTEVQAEEEPKDVQDDDSENKKLKEEKADKNQLKDRQKKHKKSDKKGARGWFVNPNAGDVEKNTAFFNNAMGNPAPAQADGGIGCVGCAEGLNESKIDDIDKFIEDIYALRKESIATEGEYGKGNLIFKELRNNGYLQKLKDLKAKEQSKQLSLEGLKEEKFDANQNFKMGKKSKE